MTKAVSIRQPWAWAVTHGYCPFIPRHRRIAYRGPLLIHAAKRDDQHGFFALLSAGVKVPRRLPHGGFVGRVHLVDCVARQTALRAGCEYITTPYAWAVLVPETRALEPCRGWPDVWDVADQAALTI